MACPRPTRRQIFVARVVSGGFRDGVLGRMAWRLLIWGRATFGIPVRREKPGKGRGRGGRFFGSLEVRLAILRPCVALDTSLFLHGALTDLLGFFCLRRSGIILRS